MPSSHTFPMCAKYAINHIVFGLDEGFRIAPIVFSGMEHAHCYEVALYSVIDTYNKYVLDPYVCDVEGIKTLRQELMTIIQNDYVEYDYDEAHQTDKSMTDCHRVDILRFKPLWRFHEKINRLLSQLLKRPVYEVL